MAQSQEIMLYKNVQFIFCIFFGLPFASKTMPNTTDLKAENAWYHHYQIAEVEGTGHVITGLEFVFVELPKFRPDLPGIKPDQRKWLRFLTEIGEEMSGTETLEELLADAAVGEALEIVQQNAYSEQELEAYDAYWDAVRVERTALLDMHAAGKVEGERLAKIEIARKLSAGGMDLRAVEDLTGLTSADWE